MTDLPDWLGSLGAREAAILVRQRDGVGQLWAAKSLGGDGIVTLSIASPRGVERAANFNAGPGALPLAVLQRIREELLDYRGTGMSVMEMSHRSAEFEEIIASAEAKLRKLMSIPDDYGVIFVQGGGSGQFTMVPANLFIAGKPVDVLHTGMWTSKAIAKLKKGTPYRLAASTAPEKLTR